MAREQYANNPSSTLNGSINSSTTTVVVTDASTFPSANFRVICESEIMICTSRSSNTLTVVRAQEGTAGASHADLTAIRCIITAGALDAIKMDVLYNALKPRVTSLSVDDDLFDDDNFSGWTKVATGSPPPAITEVEQDAALSLVTTAGGSAGMWTSYMKAKTPSVGDWISAGYNFWGFGGAYPTFSLVFADGVTHGSGNQVMWGYSGNELQSILRSETGYNTQTAATAVGMASYPISQMAHLKMKYKGSNTWDTFVSCDGIQWAQYHSNQSMGAVTPTYMGFAVTTWGGFQMTWSVKYVRFSF